MEHEATVPHSDRSSAGRPVLTATLIAKSFAGVQALKSASIELLEGEVHALVGENGAGKSTLAKVITGALVPDAGRLEVFGETISANSPTVSRALGIAAIYQHPSLFPHLTVAENIALSLESGPKPWRIDWKCRYRRAGELLGSIGAAIDPAKLARTLSMAEQQMVEIAKAIGAEAKILLMDEPTALLTKREVDKLFELIARLRGEGVGMLYVSHRLEEILAIADRITVLRDGETVACRQATEVDRSELIHLMVGRSITSIFPKREVQLDKVALEVHGLRNDEVGLHDVSFAVHAGEIFGLAGLVGSGRTELAQTLFGLTPCDSEVTVFGQAQRIASPAQAIDLGIGYLPEDRRQHGAVLEMDVATNISMASLKRISKGGLIDRGKELGLARRYVSELRVKTASVFTAVGSLSGGNQQKVALARWLAIGPRVMILDEPTQGIDVGSKAEIHELIMQLAERGMAVVLISSELPELLGMSDRIGVFHAGTIAGVLRRDEATQARVMSLAFGHSADSRLAATC